MLHKEFERFLLQDRVGNEAPTWADHRDRVGNVDCLIFQGTVEKRWGRIFSFLSWFLDMSIVRRTALTLQIPCFAAGRDDSPVRVWKSPIEYIQLRLYYVAPQFMPIGSFAATTW